MFKLSLIAATLLLASLGIPYALEQKPVVCSDNRIFYKNGTIYLCGTLSPSKAKQFTRLVSLHNPSNVWVNSEGGSGVSSVKIAKTIIDQNLDVTIFGKCLSACAHFILTLSPNIRVMPNTLIAFHHTNTGNLRLYTKNSMISEEYNFTFTRFAAHQEQEIYSTYGIDHAWLSEATARKGIGCFVEFITDGDSSIVIGHKARSRYSFWTPTRQFMNFVRTSPIRGWWPSDQEELRDIANKTSSRKPEKFVMQRLGEPNLFISEHHHEFPKC